MVAFERLDAGAYSRVAIRCPVNEIVGRDDRAASWPTKVLSLSSVLGLAQMLARSSIVKVMGARDEAIATAHKRIEGWLTRQQRKARA